ncbi:MAG TPA: hypothetical protein VK798_13345 [Alloacidobacterium sp.]|nr:hypothetical protein [Alloacidobacterium sp.]
MVGSCSPSRTLLRRFAIAISAIALASLPIITRAQNASHEDSSSSDYNKSSLSGEDIDGASLAASPSPSPTPQYGQTNTRYPTYESKWSKVAFVAGAGFNAPVFDATSFSTYGANLTLGGGWNFNKWLGTLIEYQFLDNKIPGATLAAVGAPGGYTRVWSFTIDPIVNLPSKGKFGGYFTGGGGFYRKVTTFTTPQSVLYCNFFGFCFIGSQNVVIGHFSSNQGGMNIGAGLTWKAFGPDSRGKLFAEARYLWVDSPSASATRQGTGTFTTIPVTFGIRW